MNKMKKDRPQCPFKSTDCLAWMIGNRCFCLDDTNFGNKTECPFYKNDPSTYDPKFLVQKYKEERQYERASLAE